MSKAFTSEETPDPRPLIRPAPRLAPGEIRYVTPEGEIFTPGESSGRTSPIRGETW